jgi:signal peptidase I
MALDALDLNHPAALSLLTDLLAGEVSIRLIVTGRSMRPFLRGGEAVLLRRVRTAEIRRGDLLLFRQNSGGLLLHRVVAIRRRPGLQALIQTQGDALWAPDEPVIESQVLGRVSAVLDGTTGAHLLRLDAPAQRQRALLLAVRKRARWRLRVARAALRGRHSISSSQIPL